LDISASEVAGSVPLASAAVGGRGMPTTPALSLPNPTPSIRVAPLEVEAKKSVKMGIVTPEQLPRFDRIPL
jgi:hypothetical protein